MASKESEEDLQLHFKIAELEREKEESDREKDQLKNQLTESKDLFAHLQTANRNLESQFDTIQNENEKLKETVDEVRMITGFRYCLAHECYKTLQETLNLYIPNQVFH